MLIQVTFHIASWKPGLGLRLHLITITVSLPFPVCSVPLQKESRHRGSKAANAKCIRQYMKSKRKSSKMLPSWPNVHDSSLFFSSSTYTKIFCHVKELPDSTGKSVIFKSEQSFPPYCWDFLYNLNALWILFTPGSNFCQFVSIALFKRYSNVLRTHKKMVLFDVSLIVQVLISKSYQPVLSWPLFTKQYFTSHQGSSELLLWKFFQHSLQFFTYKLDKSILYVTVWNINHEDKGWWIRRLIFL